MGNIPIPENIINEAIVKSKSASTHPTGFERFEYNDPSNGIDFSFFLKRVNSDIGEVWQFSKFHVLDWNSVSERLPEHGDEVYAINANFQPIRTTYYENGRNLENWHIWGHDNVYLQDVTHWKKQS